MNKFKTMAITALNFALPHLKDVASTTVVGYIMPLVIGVGVVCGGLGLFIGFIIGWLV